MLAIVQFPLLMRVFAPWVLPIADRLGFGGTASRLAGEGGFTDVGWEVVASRGLAEPDYSAYDTLRVLDPLIGMGWPADQANTHPPFALPFGLPLAYIDYGWWLSFWIMVSVSAIAVTMRVMKVPAWVAYPLAIGIAATFAGRDALQSTYPLAALALAMAWRFQRNWLVSGLSLATLGASRGVGLIMLAHPVLKRRWKAAALAVGVIAALTAVAVALEPSVIGEFLNKGRASIELNLARGDLLTPAALAAQRGIPEAGVWGLAAGWVGVGALLRRSPFWLLAWLTIAVTPIAWYHSPVFGLPIVVAMWWSGRLGRVLAMLVGVAFASTNVYMSVDWLVLVSAAGIAVVACRLPEGPQDVRPGAHGQSDPWATHVANMARPSP